MNFYIADMHFGHKNVIRYDNRPFDSIEEMDKAMITLWNETVGDNDVVYILGDFSWYKEERRHLFLDVLKDTRFLSEGITTIFLQKSQDTLNGFVNMQKSKMEKKKLSCLTIQCLSGMVSTETVFICMVMSITHISIITV